MQSLSESTVARIGLSRLLFRLAENVRGSSQGAALSASVNLLQDSVEAILLAIAEHVDVSIERRQDFDKYFVQIDERLRELDGPMKRLPFRARLLKLNGMRVLAKHQGIAPDRSEVDRVAVVCREFVEQCSENILGGSYWTIGPIEILDDGTLKTYLLNARSYFEEKKFVECLTECRKVLFEEIESQYSIEVFADGAKAEGILGALMSGASYYMQNKDWIDTNVRTPFEYIQINHADVDRTLLKEGFDVPVFWNLWRLTPNVFKGKQSNEWLVEYDPGLFAHPQMEDNASYVLEHTTNFVINRQMHRRGIRTQSYVPLFLELREPNVSVFQKATEDSTIIGTTLAGETTIQAMRGTPGLNGTGYFWQTMDVTAPTSSGRIGGFVRDEDIKGVADTER